MAAITPHLEQQRDPSVSPAERAWFESHAFSSRGLSGLQYDIDGGDAQLADQALQVAHANLVATAWTRDAIMRQLAGRTITVVTRGRKVRLELDQPIGLEPRFNPPGSGDMRSFNLLSWTSKMGCPSFSLPAGPPQFGGSCPGSVAGQSIVPVGTLRRASRQVEHVLQQRLNLADAVCEFCYAEGGNYRYGSKQLAQVVIYIWTQRALLDGSFVEVLSWAVENADYKLDGERNLPAERHDGRYFRIHDSGDFFNRRYLQAWKEIANRHPDIVFWAPTRIWALPQGTRWVNEINTPPSNLIIRPSQYMVDRAVPGAHLGPGWSNWATVFDTHRKPQGGPYFDDGPYNWDCQAYASVGESHNCRSAIAPDGEHGCRACWVHPELSVNYTKH